MVRLAQRTKKYAANGAPHGAPATALEVALAMLPPRQREVIVLRDVDGWSAPEVCNVLGISDTNQRVLLHRARERVRHELRQYLSGGDICQDAHSDDLP